VDEVLSDGPRAYWRLGETSGAVAADHHGLFPGIYQNGVTLGVTGALAGDTNTAARFDGVDDKVTMGDPSNGGLDFGTTDFSAEAWVKTSFNGERTLISKRPASGPYWQFTVTDDPGHEGVIRANIFDGAVTRQVYGPASRVDDGAWHHVVVVFDRDAGITVYVDGTGLSTAGAMTGSISNAAELLVAKATGYGYMLGDLDEVAVYPGLLTAARVQAHYAAGRGPL
jgi:hypothetical protein